MADQSEYYEESHPPVTDMPSSHWTPAQPGFYYQTGQQSRDSNADESAAGGSQFYTHQRFPTVVSTDRTNTVCQPSSLLHFANISQQRACMCFSGNATTPGVRSLATIVPAAATAAVLHGWSPWGVCGGCWVRHGIRPALPWDAGLVILVVFYIFANSVCCRVSLCI